MKINYEFNEEFYSIPMYVDNRVLIPRNDTEILVDKVLKDIKEKTTIIDIGTGSGCIPLSIMKNSKNNDFFAIDISLDAIEVAKINFEKYNLLDSITFLNSDLLDIFLQSNIKLNNQNIILTANLPYIKNNDFINIDKEVLLYEPHLALFGGEKTGFELYEKLLNQIFQFKIKYKIKFISLFIEIGFDQYDYSKHYLNNLGLKFEYFKDFNNIYRVIKIIF